jgi:Tol biopolymer transport system component
LIAVSGAAYRGRPVSNASPATFEQLTFRRGHIMTSRFAPDGQTVITSATWDGKPWETYQTRLDTGESTPLPLSGAGLLSISRAGDLAVKVKEDVLARVPIGGAGIRELLEHVFDADWAPDGSLAAVRHDGGRAWLEYPTGKVIYEAPKAMYRVRVSPDGAFVAVAEQEVFGGGPEWLTILDRNGTVVRQSTKRGTTSDSPLAWTADGREVWFTASEEGGRTAVHAMTVDGRERIVHRTLGSVRIHDLARDGRALLTNDSHRADMSLVDLNLPGERDLTWKDFSRPFALSDDGTMVAFGFGARTGPDGMVRSYFRATDGSPAVLLSEAGNASAFSPDRKWVVTGFPGGKYLTVVPTGVGEPRVLDAGHVVRLQSQRRWMPDGQRIVFVGGEAGRPNRLFIQSIAGGLPTALTPEGAAGPFVISHDSGFVIVSQKRQLSKFPVAGGTPTVVAGALPGDEPLAWSPDGETIWVLVGQTPPAKIFRIELRDGRRSLWREVPYPDPATIEFEQLRVVMSADGSKFVYGYQSHLSELFVATGLR